ncbi:DUF1616 domain-containing protein [Planosporangium sp. 12N6]|uniref:DUF1616 domain-containing protein n=1 Tax=Planosporangium spinosum TaxID=3402278 RepID=UPI003CF0CDE4
MRPAALHRYGAPSVAAAGAVVAAAATWVPTAVVRVPAGLLLAFVLPGLALTAALFPDRVLSAVERIVLPVALSLAVLVVGGLAMFAVGIPLGHAAWTGLSSLTTVAAAVAAVLRRRPADGTSATETAVFGQVLIVEREKLTVDAAAWRLAPLAVAVLAVLGAGVLAVRSAQTAGSPFTGLSMVPAAVDTGQPTPAQRTVRLSVRCEEGAATAYTVRVGGDSGFARTFTFALRAGATWSETMEVPSTGTVTADLFINGGGTPYRSVHLAGKG